MDKGGEEATHSQLTVFLQVITLVMLKYKTSILTTTTGLRNIMTAIKKGKTEFVAEAVLGKVFSWGCTQTVSIKAAPGVVSCNTGGCRKNWTCYHVLLSSDLTLEHRLSFDA